MKISSKYLLKKLVEYGVYPAEEVDERSKDAEDVIHDEYKGYFKVLTDSISDEEMKILLEIKQLERLTSIKRMLIFITAVVVVCVVYWLLTMQWSYVM